MQDANYIHLTETKSSVKITHLVMNNVDKKTHTTLYGEHT